MQVVRERLQLAAQIIKKYSSRKIQWHELRGFAKRTEGAGRKVVPMHAFELD